METALQKIDRANRGEENWDRYWSSRAEGSDFYSNEDRIIRGLLLIGQFANKKVLEVGAGSGRDSLRAAAAGAQAFCLDSSMDSIIFIRKIDPGRVLRLVVGDAVAAPFKPEVFDIVFHQGLMEHFRRPGDLLDENRRLLRPGGHLLVDVPQTFHPLTIVKKVLMLFDAWFAGWETQYTLRKLESLLRRHRFNPLRHIGEWMSPSLGYRCLRQALKRLGIKLPLYPAGIPGIRKVHRAVNRRLADRRWLAATYPSVGVVARKLEVNR